MIVVTGAAGFIGSCMISKLNDHNFNYIIAVDDFSDQEKNKNLAGKKIQEKVDREVFFDWLDENYKLVEFIFHLGARTDTTETDEQILNHLNLEYSKKVWNRCVDYQIPIIYASSAATYGNGEKGFDDDESKLSQLVPLNLYGESKAQFDNWAISQPKKPFFWAGLKFFNVYGGIMESHKGKMASMIFQMDQQIVANGKIKLFKSYKEDYKDGEQRRDFVHVNDLTDVCYWFMHHRIDSGIYNLGSGESQSFLNIAEVLFKNRGMNSNIEFIDMPHSIKDKYQYNTKADISKLRSIGYNKKFNRLDEIIDIIPFE